jgi:hypothetical protein
MAWEEWMLDEIEVEVTGFFTSHHIFRTEMQNLGELTFPAFSQCAEFRAADGRELLMQKTHWLGSAHELVQGDTVRATADRPGLFRRDIAVQFDGREYGLEPEGLFSQGWYLTDGKGNVLVEIQPRGVLKEGAYLTIRGAVDADLVVFAYYLVHVRQQEDAAAAVAASSAATS